jgi:(1->4)-alpha-D-glucan 1-alpha-D-glucosylmutase
VLSEIPDEWRRVVSDWMKLNSKYRTRIGTLWAPDRSDEYLFYQAALGAWPPELAGGVMPDRAPDAFVTRIDAYMQKAVREAKVHTSWIDQDQEYGRAVGAFVQKVLAGPGAARFLASFVAFARRIAHPGAINALAQLTLKLAAPGVPDFYQGTELWDFSLVDPDNRRIVDFDQRRRLLESLEPLVEAADSGRPLPGGPADALAAWPDGRIKLLVTACGLRFRRRHADVLTRAAYVPLDAKGPAGDHVVAFARRASTGTLVAIVPRLAAHLAHGDRMPIGEAAWEGTRVCLPGDAGSRYRHLFTGEIVESVGAADHSELSIAQVFRTLPVALLWSDIEG